MKYSLILILLTFTINLFGQETNPAPKRSSLQLSYGFNQVKEENLHPKVHSGTKTTFSYGRYFKSRNISELEISLSYSRVRTTYEDWSKTVNGQLAADYKYLFTAVSRNKITYSVGPEMNICYNVSFYPNWDESHLYWANQFSFGAGNRLFYNISESQSLVLDLGFSLFSVLSQPIHDRQYKIDDTSFGGIVRSLHSNPEFASFGKSFRLSGTTKYRFHLDRKVSKAFCYTFDYIKADGKNSSLFQNNSNQLGFKIYF
jgi:hypothetical protein